MSIPPKTFSVRDIKRKIDSEALYDDFIIASDLRERNMMDAGFPVRIDGLVVVVCLSGSATGMIDMKEFTSRKNDILFVLPQQIIKSVARSEDFDSLLMIFSRDKLQNVSIDIQSVIPAFIDIKDNPIRHLTDSDVRLIREYTDFIRKRIEENDLNHKPEIIRHLFMSFFYEISNLYKLRMEISKNKTRKDIIFEQFHELLTKNFKEERSVSFYADKLFITPKHLSFVVKSITGKSASEWIDGYIILESMTLLKVSNMSVKEVSNHLNFPNQSFFSKFFKRHTTISPSEYKTQ